MTADSFLLNSGDIVIVEVPEPTPIGVVTVLGPQGPVGATGATGARGPVGPAAEVRVQAFSGNGTTEVFELDVPAVSNSSVQVFRNGLAEIPGVTFVVSSSGGDTVVSFSTAPLVDDEVQVVYHT